MKNRRPFRTAAAVILLAVFAVQAIPIAYQDKPDETKIQSGPSDLRENIGLLVFLAWIWISIAVLIGFLRWKIQEADRLYRLSYMGEPGGKEPEKR